MSYGKWLGAGGMAALVSLASWTSGGCSSNSSGGGEASPPADASSDTLGPRHPEGSAPVVDAGDDSTEAGSIGNDGTTGKPCQTNADCKGPNGPGVNVCSNDPQGLNGSGNAIFPTPICFDPTPCNLPVDGNLHFCDGPDDPSSPGFCVGASSSGMGFCLPKCTFKADGSAAQGCGAKNACNFFAPLQDPTTMAVTGGVGFCYGGACAQDSDCPASNKCQTNMGVCLGMATLPLSQLGSACNPLSTTSTNACNCYSNPNSVNGLGYCAQFCLTGGNDCPAGTVCDGQEPATLTGANDASITGFAMQNTGLAGYCVPTCGAAAGDGGTADGGAAEAGAEGGAASCGGYFNASCQAYDAVGAACQPM
jgi:hypothetical protein